MNHRWSLTTVGNILARALVGWMLCGAVMGISRTLTTPDHALMIHAILAPVIFIAVSLNYFKRHHDARPSTIALSFVAVVIFLDSFVVALILLRSFEMFASVLGTWIPFVLIFLSTYITGKFVQHKSMKKP